jgi:hypothetical protein
MCLNDAGLTLTSVKTHRAVGKLCVAAKIYTVENGPDSSTALIMYNAAKHMQISVKRTPNELSQLPDAPTLKIQSQLIQIPTFAPLQTAITDLDKKPRSLQKMMIQGPVYLQTV